MESIRSSRFLLAVGGILVVLVFWSAWSLWQDVEAHPIGWKWDTSSAPIVTNYNTSYGSEISSANADFNSNTDLTVYSCNTPCAESVKHEQKFVGNVDWAAVAKAYRNGYECGDCNETSKKVTYGKVIWNSAGGPYTPSYANYLARHEMGHVFGLDHAPCQTGGDYGGNNGYLNVMAVKCPYDAPDTLQDHDISDINAKY